MKSFIPLNSIILVHVALSMALFSPIIKVSADLIDTTCQQTPFYDLCLTTLKSDPASSRADVQGLARIVAEKLQAKGNDTLNQIMEMFKEAEDPQLQKSLKNCVKAYYMIVEVDIPVALEGITKGNPKFALDGAFDVADQTDACEKSFTKSPLTSRNELVHDLSVVVVSIVETLL